MVWMTMLRGLIGLLLLLSGELMADETRTRLLARYEVLFSLQRHSVKQKMSDLLRDTENYFSKNKITIDDDPQLHRLYKKLSAYWKFFLDNYQQGMLDGWGYHRLVFNAIRDVDHESIMLAGDEDSSYYRLLYNNARANMWRSLRTYQEYFPFVKWSFCDEISESCPRQQRADRWQNIGQLANTMNSAVDHLNSKIEMLNILMRKGSKVDRQLAVRDYVQTYSEMVAKPYGALLFFVADNQHLSMVSTPRLPLFSYSLRKFSHVNSESLQQTLSELRSIFATRLSKIDTLYDENNKEPLIVFLIKHHQQAVAEFVINYPQFSAIIDHYIELVNEEYLASRLITNQLRNAGGAALISSGSVVYLVSSMIFSHKPLEVFAKSLTKVGLVLGTIATYYMTCNPSFTSLCQRPALVESPHLKRQLQEISWSLVMRQSNSLQYFLHELNRLENLKDSANYQVISIALYSGLLAIAFVKSDHNFLKKFWNSLNQPRVSKQLKNIEFGSYKGFDFSEISKIMKEYPYPEKLSLEERETVMRKLLGGNFPFDDNFKLNKDTSPEEIKELSKIGIELSEKFSPSEDNVTRLYRSMNLKEDADEINSRQLEAILEETKHYIRHLFQIDINDSRAPISL